MNLWVLFFTQHCCCFIRMKCAYSIDTRVPLVAHIIYDRSLSHFNIFISHRLFKIKCSQAKWNLGMCIMRDVATCFLLFNFLLFVFAIFKNYLTLTFCALAIFSLIQFFRFALCILTRRKCIRLHKLYTFDAELIEQRKRKRAKCSSWN